MTDKKKWPIAIIDGAEYTLDSDNKKLLELLNDNANIHIELRGHTDNIGLSQYNKTLSEKRAISVYNFLVDKWIRKERLSYKGFGDTQPIATNETDEGRAKNRRTEFQVVKIVKW